MKLLPAAIAFAVLTGPCAARPSLDARPGPEGSADALHDAGTPARAAQNAPAAAQPLAAAPARVISVIPAVTEMLFAMGAGPQVVAVGSFDRFPAAVEKLPRVGALIDPDVERILSLRPDLVVVYGSQTDLRTQLERAQIPVYTYSHAGLPDITVTIRSLGTRVGRGPAAEDLAAGIERRIAEVRRRVAGRPPPRTLIVFEREALALRGVYASGGIGFIHDMVEAAGGTNVFAEVKRQAVQATTELILSRRPEVVLDLRGEDVSPETARREAAVWQALPAVPAVRSGRVYVIGDQRTVVPGPRVAEAIELFARRLHPESFAQELPASSLRSSTRAKAAHRSLGEGGPPCLRTSSGRQARFQPSLLNAREGCPP
jgi:iron complex transport system substrate-binding protein